MTGSSSTTTSPQQNASKSANDTPIQSPKNKERLKAVFYYRKSLLTQYIQELDNLRIMNAAEIQALRSVILITKNHVGDFHHVFKLDNIRKTLYNGKLQNGVNIAAKGEANFILIQGVANKEVCILQLCTKTGNGRLHFKGSSNTFRTEHLLTQNDQCWNSLVQFTGPNCDVQKLTELQANVRTFLKVADS